MLLEMFIRSPEQKALSLFVMNPDRPFYVREISRTLKISLGATHAALVSLEKSGLLVAQYIGRTKLYRLDTYHPIIKIFRILNTLLILEPLVRALKENSRHVILYGSYSTGTFIRGSDLDLFVVSEDKREVRSQIESFKRKISLDIRSIIKNKVEWMELEKLDPEFFDEIDHGITLWKKPIDETGF